VSNVGGKPDPERRAAATDGAAGAHAMSAVKPKELLFLGKNAPLAPL